MALEVFRVRSVDQRLEAVRASDAVELRVELGLAVEAAVRVVLHVVRVVQLVGVHRLMRNAAALAEGADVRELPRVQAG